MNTQYARFLTRLHPRAWRLRYGDEFIELLVRLPASPAVICDAVAHALRLRRGMLVLASIGAMGVIVLVAAYTWNSRPSEAHNEEATLSPCHAYSSTASTQFVRTERCLS